MGYVGTRIAGLADYRKPFDGSLALVAGWYVWIEFAPVKAIREEDGRVIGGEEGAEAVPTHLFVADSLESF